MTAPDKPLIFVAEDSRFFLSVVRWAVEERLGYDMVHATTLAEAKAILAARAGDIHAALLDLNLPDAPNGEVIDAVAAHDIPTIVFTAGFNDETREFILSKGVVDYITKDTPNGIEMVIELLERLGRNAAVKVLVVDDSRVTRAQLKRLLNQHRFTVLEATDGPQALARLDEHPDIALVITDFNMPGYNGGELTRRIRAKRGPEELAIIGLSAYGNPTVSANFMKSGANDYMNKPFVPEELFCRLYQNLRGIERMTRMRSGEARMRLAMEAAEAASLAKTNFMSQMSHELRTPLNAIIGFSQLLLADGTAPLKGEQAERATRILAAGDHLLELISDALDIARVEAGRADLSDEVVDLGALCEGVAEMVSALAESREVTLAVALPPGLRLRGDGRRLRQVVLNVVSNAIKFTPTDGSVTVTGGIDDGGRAFVEVRDTGVGMSEAEIAVALEPFGQVGALAAREHGTGLGLPLARAFVEAHGGVMEIASVPDQGTAVTIRLPVDRVITS